MKIFRAVVFAAVALCAVQAFAVEHTEVTKVARLPFLRGMGFDGYYGGRNGTFMTDASMYKKLAAMGFDHIRVPIDFRDYSTYDSSTGVTTLKESGSWGRPGFSTFDKIIDYAEAAGLYIYLDFHGLDKFPVESVASSNQFISIWKAVAERYKDRSNKVIFEIWNEPHWELEPEPICAVEKDVVKEIRKTNPTRLILYDIPGGGGSWPLGHKAHDLLEMPENDNNIAVVSHQYTPGRFTHQGEQWVDNPENTAIGIDEQYCTGTNNNVAQYSTPRKELLKDLQNARDWVEWSDVPQVINEFNVSNQLLGQGNFSKADIVEWLSIVSRFCESNNIPWAPWSCRSSFGGVGGMDCCTSSWALYDYIKPGLFPDLKTTDDFSVSDYPKSIDITFSGYTGSSTLENFPVLVKLSEDSIPGFKYSDFTRADGYDLCFTDASGNLIPHEIDTWNPGGVSTVWVKVPSLAGTTTKIVARYGCAKPIVHKVESVWDSDYVGVWHLGERKLPLADSSNESRDVTSRDGDGISFGSAGVVGKAVDFGAANSSRSLNMDDHRLLDGFTNVTVEAWTKQAAHATNAGILSKRTGNGSQMSYFMYDNGSGTTMKYSANGTSSVDSNVTLQPELGCWNHQAYSLDTTKTSSNSKGYLNGVLAGTANVSLSGGIYAGDAELHVGNFQSDDSRNFPGSIDEVRISKCVRSADWVKASYDTVEKCDFAVYSLQGAGTQNPTLYIPVDRGATSTLDASEIKSWTTKIVKDGDGTLVAAPVTSSSITNLSVWGGTVRLASSASASVVSKIVELEFSAGTGLDLSGKSYTVAKLMGAPSVLNAATFTVTGSWTVEAPGAMSVSGALAFGSGAVFALADESKFSSVGYSGVAVATATGGITGMPGIASDEFRLKLSADGKSLLLCSNTPDSADWMAFAKLVTVSFGGVQSGVTLVDFPVLVKLSTAIEGFSYADFQLPNGGDLRFVDADGTLLPHEIDTWNQSGVSTVWVKVPTLNASTTIKAYYGCRHPVGALNSKDVWDDDYVGVWHLGESALPMKESSETSSDFKVASGAKIKYAQAGAVGGSVDFRSANSDSALLAPDHPALDGFSKFTVELWMNQVKKQYAGILSKRVRYEFKNSYYLYHTGNYVSLYAATNAASPAAWAFNQNADTNQWSHLAFAVDMTTSSGNIHGYTNGVGKAGNVSFRSDTVPDTTTTLCLGNIQNGSWLGNRFNGRIDEVRISKCVRSAAWIKATHDTIANANFATYEVETVVPPPAFASDVAGFDYTNRVVTVTNATAGATLTLTATASDGTTTTATAAVDANGEATFNVATAPGTVYSYTVASGDATVATGGFFTGGWDAGGSLFSAAPNGSGGSVEVNGAWTTAPSGTNAAHYAVDPGADFALSPDASSATDGELVRVDVAVQYESFDEVGNLSSGELSGRIAGMTAATSGGTAKWMVGAGNGWKPLVGGPVPQTDTPYVLRMEANFKAAPPKVRCSVSADAGATFAVLSDADGNTWHDAAKSALSGVEIDGRGNVASVDGALANANVAEADGVGRASLADAIASATNTLVLLTNATWPTNTPVGTVSLNRGGFAVQGVTLDGNDKVVVQSGYSSIPGEGRVNITLAQAAALGVTTANQTPAQIAAALAANGANGIPRWKSYVLGLDPTDATAQPKATIVMNGENVALALVGIDVNAASGATVSYKVYKFADLTDMAAAEAVGSDRAVDATAEVPKDATAPKMFYRLKVDVKGY